MKTFYGVTACIALLVAAGCKPQTTDGAATADGAHAQAATQDKRATASGALAIAITSCEAMAGHIDAWVAGKTRMPLDEVDGKGGIHCGWFDEATGEMFTLAVEYARGAGPTPALEGRVAVPADLFDARGGNGTAADGQDTKQAWRNVIFSAPDVAVSLNHSVPLAQRDTLISADQAYAVTPKLVR